MSEFAESDFLPISALQHLAFCERQWGLIHLEQLWEENRLTAEGKLLHEKVDEGPDETRDGVRTVRSLALRSFRLGLIGKSDVVEFPKEPDAAPLPVEYKRGRPKIEHWDEIQLCAQALCLEEMMGVPVILGAIYYGQPRRRVDDAEEGEVDVGRVHQPLHPVAAGQVVGVVAGDLVGLEEDEQLLERLAALVVEDDVGVGDNQPIGADDRAGADRAGLALLAVDQHHAGGDLRVQLLVVDLLGAHGGGEQRRAAERERGGDLGTHSTSVTWRATQCNGIG